MSMSTKSINQVSFFKKEDKMYIEDEFSLDNNQNYHNQGRQNNENLSNSNFQYKPKIVSEGKFTQNPFITSEKIKHKNKTLYHPFDSEMKFTTKQYKHMEATHLFKDLYSTQSGELIANLAKITKHKNLKKNKSQDFFNLKKKHHLDDEIEPK